jgi:hypothetical protein
MTLVPGGHALLEHEQAVEPAGVMPQSWLV